MDNASCSQAIYFLIRKWRNEGKKTNPHCNLPKWKKELPWVPRHEEGIHFGDFLVWSKAMNVNKTISTVCLFVCLFLFLFSFISSHLRLRGVCSLMEFQVQLTNPRAQLAAVTWFKGMEEFMRVWQLHPESVNNENHIMNNQTVTSSNAWLIFLALAFRLRCPEKKVIPYCKGMTCAM